ncbi:MAG: 30S ribosomal protein S24e [Thermoplasmata archaeon]|nr:30S ribosomal protein S24e [Thermoplasmata archaeon]
MEIQITEKKDNPLLNRTEVTFVISHPKGQTPKRNEVKDALANLLGAKKEMIIINNMDTTFGKPETYGYAKIYKTVEDARKVEPVHIQKRNHIYVEKKKEEGGE